MKNKILMIVNEFPPMAESGVQRPLKFLKYLAKDGWETFVITPSKPVKKTIDFTLNDEIPQSTKVFKTHSFGISATSEDILAEKRSEFLKAQNPLQQLLWKFLKFINDLIMPIDKQAGWVPFATFKAIQVIRKHNIRNIYITGFPFSAFICGLILKRVFGKKIFWVADYRDAWQFGPLIAKNVYPFRYNIICKTDESVLKKADSIVFTSPYVKDFYTVKYPWLNTKAEVITNGYDEDDFTGLEPVEFDRFTFIYMGKIYTTKRDPIPLLQAIKQYMKVDYQYLHIGTIGKLMLNQIEKNEPDFFKYYGYMPHTKAISYSAGADVNIIIINNDPDSVGEIPGKLFELLRIGKPILLIGPHQQLIKDIFAQTKIGITAKADDVNDIKEALSKLLSNDYVIDLKKYDIEQYSRNKLTQKLEALYNADKKKA